MKTTPQTKKSVDPKDIRHFLAIVGLIVGSFLLVVSLGVFAYVQTAVADNEPTAQTPGSKPAAAAAAPDDKGGFIANLLLPDEKTNFLVVGLDQGESLTDVIMVGCFDRETQKIDIISIPRDTRVVMSKEDIKKLNSLGRYPPTHGVMKINAINAYAGAYGMEYLQNQLESMLGIEIDYYASVNLKAFRNIVDAVDGVWMEIPSSGLYYSAPDQDLLINVPGGMQLLDGRAAEGVVRFRSSYGQADLKRIEMQQEFMKQFFAQVMNKETIMKNAGSFLSTIISYVRTDFGIQDIPLYLRYVNSLSAENLSMHTLPGYAEYEGDASYFFIDEAATTELVDEIFHKQAAPEDILPTPDEPVDLKSLTVQILNGTGAAGLAAETKESLSADGITVAQVGDYGGSRKTYTRIVTGKPGIAEGFRPYFKNIVEEIDDTQLTDGVDVVIILGTGEI